MRRLIACLVVAIVALGVGAAGQQTSDDSALRARIEARYDVVPIADGIALTPKVRNTDVRLIEISDVISVNGTVVTGRELRERVGDDADDILKLSYLDPSARRTLFATSAPAESPQAEAPGGSGRSSSRRAERSTGDRVRVFGDVTVREGEDVSGGVVAVLGSVRVDGEVEVWSTSPRSFSLSISRSICSSRCCSSPSGSLPPRPPPPPPPRPGPDAPRSGT